MKNAPKTRRELRARRHARVRGRVRGTATRPRLAVFRSNRYLSVQLIDDDARRTLASAHGGTEGGAQAAQAKSVGTAIAKKAKSIGVTAVVFDRGGYRYGGHLRSLAEAARVGGLIF